MRAFEIAATAAGCASIFHTVASHFFILRFHLWILMSQNPSLCKFRKQAIQKTLKEIQDDKEMSMVILIIGILIAGISGGADLYSDKI